MRKKNKYVCATLNCIEHFVILASRITGCISISAFGFLIGIRIGIKSSGIGLKNCAITARIKMYKSMIKKKRMKNEKIVLLAKCKLNSIKVLISKALTGSVISHDEFALINHVQK